MTNSGDGSDRIDALDGLRGLAVLAVVGFHYFSRWTPPLNATSLYPFGSALASFSVFRFGYLGVHLFFLVSGFVISMTLVRCASWSDFAVRRFARLFPAMLLASTLTFLIVGLLTPHFWSPHACSFLPSLTFVEPLVYSRLFGLDCEFMDSAYWSLFVEVRFYAWAALIYFVGSKRAFLLRAAILMNLALLVLALEQWAPRTPGIGLLDLLLFPTYAPWLFAGVGFYFVWTGQSPWLARLVVIEGAATALANSWLNNGHLEWIAILAIFALFASFARRAQIMRIFATHWLTQVGAASYALYLLHQRIGVTLTAAIANSLGITGPWSALIPCGVAVGITLAAMVIYNVYEVPARRVITRFGQKLVMAVSTAKTAPEGSTT